MRTLRSFSRNSASSSVGGSNSYASTRFDVSGDIHHRTVTLCIDTSLYGFDIFADCDFAAAFSSDAIFGARDEAGNLNGATVSCFNTFFAARGTANDGDLTSARNINSDISTRD